MKPINFKEVNVIYGKGQPGVEELPALVNYADGIAISCFKLTWWERLQVLLTGRLWHCLYTFGQPLQPMWLTSSSRQAMELADGTFECRGCGNVLHKNQCIRTPGICYLCDPAVTLDELMAREGKEVEYYAARKD